MFTTRKTIRRKFQQAFTLGEVVIALVIFTMMTILFAAVFPVAIRAAHYSNYYAQAALLAQHKLDQLRSAGFTNLNCTGLVDLGVVDSSSTVCGPSYTFTGVDNLSSFFPSGTTGTITITDYSTLSNVTSPPPAGQVYIATVVISWPGAGKTQSSYTASAMIVSMVHQ